MPTKRNLLNKGFTLIELMITVAIVAILASIAVPSYRDYVTRGRIPQATNNLASMSAKLEQFFQDNRTYVGACVDETVAPRPTSPDFDYGCVLAADGYTITATGKGSMSGFTYTINQSNVRATTTVPTGWTANAGCWVTKKGGLC